MSETFEAVYQRLRQLMLDAAPTMVIAKDLPGSLELRTSEIDPKTKEASWFGTVTVKKSYVAVHLIPLYLKPELAADCSPALTKRRQGKTCFNFLREDDDLFDELEALIKRCNR